MEKYSTTTALPQVEPEFNETFNLTTIKPDGTEDKVVSLGTGKLRRMPRSKKVTIDMGKVKILSKLLKESM